MRRWILLALAVCLPLAAVVVMGRRPAEDQLVPMAMVDGVLYRYVETLEGGPSSRPDGVLTERIGNRVPERDGQYNFEVEELPYWKHSQGICVYVKENGNYLLFEETEIQE